MNTKRPKVVEWLETDVRRVLAGNQSPMTHWGTNTYIVGRRQVAVIDPGPDNTDHLVNILGALEPGETISHIFVTHSHVDHSPLAAALSAATGAPVLAYGDATAGRSDIMGQLAKTGLVGGGEGIDHGFAPDKTLADGQTVMGENWELTAHWTPGHLGNHLSFSFGNSVFTGDHIMGWASSLVSPPDGDLTDFMASTQKLADLGARVFHPGHGAPVGDPEGRANWLIEHRLSRRESILTALTDGPADAKTLTRQIYNDVPAQLLPAAERNVFAHLIDLVQTSDATAQNNIALSARFQRI